MKSRTISVLLSVAVLMTAAHPISAAAEAAESNFAVPEPCVTEETAETDTCDYTFAQFFTGEGVDITALEADAALNPSLHNIWMDEAYTAKSSYYGKGQHAVLVNGSLFIVGNGKATLKEKNVRGFAHIEPKDQAGTVMPADLLLRSDGTLLVNDKAIEDVKFSSLERDFAVTSDGRAFAILPYYDNFFPILILKDFKYFVPDYPDQNLYYNTDREICWFEYGYDASEQISINTRKLGIVNPTRIEGDLYLDRANTLYRLTLSKQPSTERICASLTSFEYIGDKNGYRNYGYTRENDDKRYEVLSNLKSSENVLNTKIASGTFKLSNGTSGTYAINRRRVLSVSCGNNSFSVSKAEAVICAEYSSSQRQTTLYFVRTDGSIWKYCFETNDCKELASVTESAVKGDINGDGKLDVADMTLLRKYLDNESVEITRWKAGDLNKDCILDSIDLALMRREFRL
ncbi:MAG: dockerin type I repeat-containing protein [Oscillospiraceae bacterium]|nr:dockerin type I repeat-containing protein [Oscillospiraceae bacterium]